MFSRIVTLFALSTFVTGAALAQTGSDISAGADNTQTASKLGIETITVEAQKREQSEQEVSLAVTALDDARIEAFNARDIRDLTGLVPNLVITPGGLGPSLANISLRGVNSQDPEKSFDPAIGVFLDGIYLGTSAFNMLDTFDLERVEVLRGPQGTLFGRNTTGGVISAYRTEPTGEFGAKLGAIIGSHGRHDFKAVLNAPIVEDRLALKVAGYYQGDSGMWRNPTGGPDGAVDRWSISTALKFTPSENFQLLLTYDHAEDDSELGPFGPRGVSTPQPLPIRITQTDFPVSPATVFAAHPPDAFCVLPGGVCQPANPGRTTNQNGPHFQNSHLNALTMEAVWDISDNLAVTALFGWRDSREEVFIDFDGTEQTIFDVVRVQDYEQYSGELQVASSFDGWFNFVAGLYYFRSEYSLEQAIKLDLAVVGAPFPLGVGFVNGAGDEDQHTSDSYAIFAQGEITLTDTLALTLGGRATWDRRSIATQFYDAPFSPFAPYQVTDGVPENRPLDEAGAARESWFEVTPKVALTWQAADNILVYLSFTRGYNSGGFSARAGTVTDVTTPFDPEFINAYELGVKSDLLDGRLRLNAAIFLNDYNNKQEEAISPAPPPTFTSTTVRNVAGARIAGFELEVAALITEVFRIDASFGYLDAQYTSFDGFLGSSEFVSDPAQPPGTLIAADFSTLQLRRAPEFTFSISPTYSQQVGPGYLTLSTTVRFVDSHFTEFFNDPRGRLGNQWFVDAYIQYQFGGPELDAYTIKVFGKNLAKEDGFSTFVNSIVDFGGLQQPRQWGIEVIGKF